MDLLNSIIKYNIDLCDIYSNKKTDYLTYILQLRSEFVSGQYILYYRIQRPYSFNTIKIPTLFEKYSSGLVISHKYEIYQIYGSSLTTSDFEISNSLSTIFRAFATGYKKYEKDKVIFTQIKNFSNSDLLWGFLKKPHNITDYIFIDYYFSKKLKLGKRL